MRPQKPSDIHLDEGWPFPSLLHRPRAERELDAGHVDESMVAAWSRVSMPVDYTFPRTIVGVVSICVRGTTRVGWLVTLPGTEHVSQCNNVDALTGGKDEQHLPW